MGRIIASLLGIIVAAMSMQLMARHRLLSVIDRAKLGELEERMGIPRLSDRGWAYEGGHLVKGSKVAGRSLLDSYWSRRRSYPLWQAGLACFIVANVGAVVFALL